MKIGELCTYAPKSTIKAGSGLLNGQYIFFTSSVDESKRYSDYQLDCEGIIMGTGGNATLHYYNGKFSTSTDCVVLLPNNSVRCKYLFYFLLANFDILEAGFKGAGLQHTNKKYIDGIDLPFIPSITDQDYVIKVLDIVKEIIEERRKELLKLDDLIKARFVEIFGDPVINAKGYFKCKLEDVCLSIVDGSHNPPEGVNYSEYLMLSSKNVVNNELNFENPRYLTKEQFVLEDKRTKVEPGDVLFTIVGTIGRSAIINPEILNIVLQRSVAVLKPNREKINSIYLKYHLDLIQSVVEKEAHGIAQLGIYLSQVRNLPIILPSINAQNEFASFVEQIDKSKFVDVWVLIKLLSDTIFREVSI